MEYKSWISLFARSVTVANWSEYNTILRNRGRIDFMIAENLSRVWHEDNTRNRKAGGQRRGSVAKIIIKLQGRGRTVNLVVV